MPSNAIIGSSMGRAQPLEFAASSGLFGPLTLELYELLLCSPEGASIGAIASKTRLMSLNYIRAEEASHGDPSSDRRAKAVRSAISRDSSKIAGRLRQRDAGLDYGSALRSLLGIEPGVAGWSLAERRQRTAQKLGRMNARSLSKTRYEPSYKPSFELELLDALARKMLSRETDFVRSQSPSLETITSTPVGEIPSYALLARVWSAAHFIQGSVESLLAMIDIPDNAKEVFTISMSLLSYWHDLQSVMAEPDEWELHRYSDVRLDQLDGVPPRGLLRIMYQCLPHSIHDRWLEIRQAASDNEELERLSSTDDQTSWLYNLTSWFRSCRCETSTGIGANCQVHGFLLAANWLELSVETAWFDIPRHLESPAAYVFSQYSVARELGLQGS